MRQTHHQRILTLMREQGCITPMMAYEQIGETKLATRIGEMIRKGYRIIKTRAQAPNRFGQMTNFMTYRLVE